MENAKYRIGQIVYIIDDDKPHKIISKKQDAGGYWLYRVSGLKREQQRDFLEPRMSAPLRRSDKRSLTTFSVHGRTFKTVDEFPDGYVVWNIGRYNFPIPGYIPICKPEKGTRNVDLNKLKAIKVGNEKKASKIMAAARFDTIGKKEFQKLISKKVKK